MKKPFVLMILDGFGYCESDYGNAIKAANMPNYQRIHESNPHTVIEASGLAVGLPEGQMGNSEVGHTNIGAGRIVYQPLTMISKSVKDGDFFQNAVLLDAIQQAVSKNKKIHLMGLLSDGGVHSHIEHLFALIDLAKKNGAQNLYVHCFMDGRDVPPTSGSEYVKALEEKLKETGIGSIATIGGRYFGMDRDTNWDRIKKAYDASVFGSGRRYYSAYDYVASSYEKRIFDEFLEPCVIDPDGTIEDGDSVIFFNFRPDRAREMTRALTEKDFSFFERKKMDLNFVCMKEYDASFQNVKVAFPPKSLENTFGEYISSLGLKQLRIAETEKYAHVTFFFNGGVEKMFPGEDRALISSPKVATYDLKPEMSVYEVTERLLKELDRDYYDVVILNFANPDMVGHTGVFEAAVKACEAVDECLGKICDKVKEKGGTVILTADHGNADQMISDDGSPCTSHSTRPVPVTIMGINGKLKESGRLADLAPTMLDIMGFDKPSEMDGQSLILERI